MTNGLWARGGWPNKTDTNAMERTGDQDDESSGETVSETQPMRALLITKGAPHRDQLGRFLDRLNQLGAMRMFAISSFASIKNAGSQLQLVGNALDGVYKDWSEKRNDIETVHRDLKQRNSEKIDTYLQAQLAALKNKIDLEGLNEEQKKRLVPRSPVEAAIADIRARSLSDLIRSTDERLIGLGAELDKMGVEGAGRLKYLINRSAYYRREFWRLWPTLEVENISGWTNYEQFVTRNVKPTFDYIEAVGERIDGIRDRLQSATEAIQTSALIVEAEETRTNTDALAKIAGYMNTAGVWTKRAGKGAIIVGSILVLDRFIQRLQESETVSKLYEGSQMQGWFAEGYNWIEAALKVIGG